MLEVSASGLAGLIEGLARAKRLRPARLRLRGIRIRLHLSALIWQAYRAAYEAERARLAS